MRRLCFVEKVDVVRVSRHCENIYVVNSIVKILAWIGVSCIYGVWFPIESIGCVFRECGCCPGIGVNC